MNILNYWRWKQKIKARDKKRRPTTLQGIQNQRENYLRSLINRENHLRALMNEKQSSISGLEAWLPDKSSNDPFFGIDRTLNTVRFTQPYRLTFKEKLRKIWRTLVNFIKN